jgi:hypothetical protein
MRYVVREASLWGPPRPPQRVEHDSLAAARADVRRRLSVRRLSPVRRVDIPGTSGPVEAWSDGQAEIQIWKIET